MIVVPCAKSAAKKAQSAMEYLMTYGWAILIIAVVLGALYQLGVFSQYAFAPKAPPGSCQIYRPNGPGTTQFISLQGVCSGELPEYVSVFNGNSYIGTNLKRNVTQSGWTETAWVYITGDSTSWCGGHSNVILNDRGPGSGYSLTLGTSPITSNGYGFFFGFDTNGVGDFASSYQVYKYNTWYFIAGTYNSSYGFTLYVDGQKAAYYLNSGTYGPGPTCTAGALPSSFPSQYPWIIGYEQAWASYFYGDAANIAIYNSSLSANDIMTLYQEGIGGAPVRLQNLVAWWPLNGNANDYSGNKNSGMPEGIDYTGSWYSGYVQP
ncbi:MAG: LamG domain-containing protein [Candidatus Micrarchaeia archaeon]